MKYKWTDLPKPLNCFTIRNAVMTDLGTGNIIQYYSANTKIVVVQKCATYKDTFYRTETAKRNHLDYAFEATDLGLPKEPASSVHSSFSPREKNTIPTPRTLQRRAKKQKPSAKKVAIHKDEGGGGLHKLFNKFFGRSNG